MKGFHSPVMADEVSCLLIINFRLNCTIFMSQNVLSSGVVIENYRQLGC